MRIRLLSGGAAHAVVAALAAPFRAETGCEIDGTFSAVGAMREQLLAGAPADVVILSRKLVDALVASGHVRAGSCADLGVVRTGIAVRAGDAFPDVAGAAALGAALAAAGEVHFPDPERATAGIHFAGVLDALGLRAALAARLRTHPNGAAAMRALAASGAARPIGCTQITEIKATPGVALVAPLPAEFELATVYTAGVCARAAAPDAARRLVALLAGEGSRAVRREAGFEL